MKGYGKIMNEVLFVIICTVCMLLGAGLLGVIFDEEGIFKKKDHK